MILAAGGALAFSATRAPGVRAGAWRLAFFDDFSHGLRASRWGLYSGRPGGDPGGWWDPSHVVVSRGIVSLETYRDPRFGGRWVSGGMSSAPALKQTYGKYELRLRMDPGHGVGVVALLWPVHRWPPEIDFAENGGQTRSRQQVTATLHYGSRNAVIQHTVHANFSRWHVLGVEWTPRRLLYTLDGRRWAMVRGSAVPSVPMELDVQTQAGTCGDPYAPCPDSSTPAHVSAQIDWVAAWAYRGAPGR